MNQKISPWWWLLAIPVGAWAYIEFIWGPAFAEGLRKDFELPPKDQK